MWILWFLSGFFSLESKVSYPVLLVIDGIMYLSAAYNNLWALNAETGEPIWHYEERFADRFEDMLRTGE